MNNQEQNPLADVAETIRNQGLPSADVMREQITAMELMRTAEIARLREKVARYSILFEKWKKGETDETETNEMLILNDELESLRTDR